MSSETAETPRWYAIHTRPRQEDRAEGNLRAQGIPTLAPRLRQRRRGASAVTPLFAGYLFACFDVKTRLHSVRFTRGVHSVVACGGQLAIVDDEIISVIRSRLGTDGTVAPPHSLKRGDRVMIEEGPLKSVVGIFEREVGSSDRVLILLTAVRCAARIAVDPDVLGRL